MDRSKRWWILCFVVAPAVLGGFVAGWQKASAAPCLLCPCKDVTYWWTSPNGVTYANVAYVTGSTTLRTTNALFNINALSPCKSSSTSDPAGTYSMRSYNDAAVTCTPGLGATLVESSPGTPPGTFVANINRFTCH